MRTLRPTLGAASPYLRSFRATVTIASEASVPLSQSLPRFMDEPCTVPEPV